VIEGLHEWLERWAPLAEWGVAVGTAALALATYALAKRASEEATAVRAEAEQLAAQGAAALRAYAYPETTAEWAWGAGEWGEGRRDRVLPLRNGGPGVALNVGGHFQAGTQGRHTTLYAGSIAPGQAFNARPATPIEGGWASWVGSYHCELSYSDLNNEHWTTRFTITVGEDYQIVAEHQPPERLSAAAP
jgi:hypothetical protein